ncbi:LuxR C-terminal-related transcriptional regulator [uncultured Clostridium sp.]
MELSEEQKEMLEKNYKKVTNKELAKMLGVSEATITFHTKGRSKK